MIRKFIMLLYRIKQVFSFGRRKPKKEKEIEVPNERYTLW
jgi:hypothetical protein